MGEAPGVHERAGEIGDRVGPEVVHRQVPYPVHRQAGPLQCSSGSRHGHVDGIALRGHPPDRQRRRVTEDPVGPVHGGQGAGPPLVHPLGEDHDSGVGAHQPAGGHPDADAVPVDLPSEVRGPRDPLRTEVGVVVLGHEARLPPPTPPPPDSRRTRRRRTRLWIQAVYAWGGFRWPKPPRTHIAGLFSP